MQGLHRLHAGRAARRNPRSEQACRHANGDGRHEQLRAHGHVRRLARDAEGLVEECAHRQRDAAGDEGAGGHSQERPGDTHHGALAKEQPLDLAASGAERTQNGDLGSPLRHRHAKGVVDDEHPDEEREQARRAHHHRKRRDHRLEVLAATRRRLNLKSRTEKRLQLTRTFSDGEPGFQREIEPIEGATAAEHPLGRVDVHDGEIAAKGARQAARFHDAANSELPLPFDGAKLDMTPDRQPVARGERAGQHDRVRLREEHERIVDDHIVCAFEIVVSQAAVAGHVDAENQEAALAAHAGTHDRFDHRYGDTNGPGGLHSLEHIFGKPAFSRRHLQLGLAGNAIHGLRKREHHAAIGAVHSDEHGHAQNDAAGRQDHSQPMLARIRPRDQPQQDHGCVSGTASISSGNRRADPE